ncbi:MAG: 3'(2'),5'-bisphosphate nucleotidase CysQ family protein [Nitrosarchaeum sp.]
MSSKILTKSSRVRLRKSNLPEFKIAQEAAIAGGKEILKVYRKNFSSKVKKDNSPITEADINSNKIIKKILSKTGYSILSEEDKDSKKRLKQKRVWIVDPLDGTTDFVNRTGEFTVMIALVEDKKPILGVIYWPTENILFVAQKDYGAWRFSNHSWKRMRTSKVSDMKKCRAIGSRYHISDVEKVLLDKLYIKKFTSVGSSLKVAQISSGAADVYLTTTNKMKEWDTCASYCLVSEAGGKMTDMLGNDVSYNNQNVIHQNGILVTNGLVHDKIVKEFKKLD